MSDRSLCNVLCPKKLLRATLVLGLALCLFGRGGAARLWAKDQAKDDTGKRRVAARCLTAKATIARREQPKKSWHIVDEKETLYSGDLLLGMPGAMLTSPNGAVRLDFLSDLDRNSPYPIHECAVVLNDNAKMDLDVTLDRGRIDLVNTKKKGAATVRVRVRGEFWDFTLEEPGTSVALELYGRWPRGVTFTKTPGPKDVPTADLIILVLKGEVYLKHKDFEHALKAPPGPAMIEWDSVSGADETPEPVKKLPEWAVIDGKESDLAKRKKATLERFRKTVLAKSSIDAAVQELLQSDNKSDRILAVYLMGAMDNLRGLGKALREAQHEDIWEHGVLALRHWIGRCPGQDQMLYSGLVKENKFSPVHAETVVQLLHSFGDTDLACPETYQTLVDFLDHEKLGIRGLAYWHLSRLVPEGKKFGYNPTDLEKKRAAAVAKWKKLIPEGKMPPKPKVDAEKD